MLVASEVHDEQAVVALRPEEAQDEGMRAQDGAIEAVRALSVIDDDNVPVGIVDSQDLTRLKLL